MTESDACLAEVVGGHLDIDFVADADADEVFAHLAGDMGEDFVSVGQGDSEHGAGQHLGYRAGQFDWFFFGHANDGCVRYFMPLSRAEINPQSGGQGLKTHWTFERKPVQSRPVMKNNLVPTLLNWVLATSVILAIWSCTQFFFRTRDLRGQAALLQAEMGKFQQNRNFLNLLLNDTVEYSRRNPDMEKVLESVGLKFNRNTNAAAASKTGAK